MITHTITHMIMGMGMDKGALYRLMAWLSPSYPVGAFAYSHGLEWMVEQGTVTSVTSLTAWIEDVVRHGGGWSDAVIFQHAWAATAAGDGEHLTEIAELAHALSISKERKLETMAQGRAFMTATDAAWSYPPVPGFSLPFADCPYPVAVAMAASGHKIPMEDALNAYLHAFVANLVSAGVRLIPLGQTDGQRALATLEPVLSDVAEAALSAPLSRVGGCAMLTDIASMSHETQYTRLFRS